jgi:S1-C subfamily serine protease
VRRWAYFSAAGIAGVGFAVALCSPIAAQSFDCRTDTHADERAICGNAELGELDIRMSNSFYRLFNSLSGSARSELRSQHSGWLRERRECGGNVRCLRDKYRQRISELESLQGYPSPPARNDTPPSAQPQTEATSSGTGFFVSLPGYVLTNRHVVDGCRTATVSRPGYPSSDARIVGVDATNDLALLTTGMGTKMVPPFRIGVRVGESVFVYGFPLAGLLSSSGNFTVGNITSVAGLGDDSRILQISAPVQPGNSGGPLLDKSGNVVGIIVSKLNALRLAQVTQDVPQNINFAIKASIAANFLEVNNIQAQVGSNAATLEPTEIAERAKQFTVQVTCRRVTEAVPTPEPPRRQRQPTLLESSSGRWAIETPLNCNLPTKSYSLKVDGGNIIWRDGTGKIDIESVVFSGESEFQTITVRSIHPNGPGEKLGTTWTYSSLRKDRISVKPGGMNAFRLARCPS